MSDKKVILITGGASGLGRILVEEFLKIDCNVVFTYLNNDAKAKEITEEYGDNVLAIKSDASVYNEVKKVISKTIECFGTIDVLINNASSVKDGSIGEINPEEWDFTLKNVLYSCFNFTNEVSKVFIKKESGKIINIGSINGLRGREGSVAYSSAKAGIIGLTKTIAKELGPYNITANVIAPGFINTERHSNMGYFMKKMVLEECAVKKFAEPIDVANLVLFLASDESNCITGQVYQIDCGQYI